MQADELLKQIFENKRPDPAFASWVKSSKRYSAFAETYSGKIRKKVRTAQDEAGLRDVLFELEIAYLLLQETRFTLEYEPYRDQRGPDFTVTYKTHTPFNVEARRIRGLVDASDKNLMTTRLMDAVCDKVGQMPPSIINILALTSAVMIQEDEFTQAMMTLRTVAERKVEEFFTRRGFASTTDFIRQYHRLSGVLYVENNMIYLWTNPLAKHAVPKEIANSLTRLRKP